MKTVLVLGGYGLIGSACMRALAMAGFEVIGVGRSQAATETLAPYRWIVRNITDLSIDDWIKVLSGVDIVVNASGALQSGAKDNLTAIHVAAIDTLLDAMQSSNARLVQISAAGVTSTASTAFFRTKARGDALIRARAKDWVILRPALVLSSEAYGGTALLRAASALPGVMPHILPNAQIQTVHVDDVAAAVVSAATGKIAPGTVIDLAEPESHSFPDLCTKIRSWLGIPPARFQFRVPQFVLGASGKVADGLGHLGWRSPLRTTALTALADGVRADPGHQSIPCRSLDDTLAAIPATRQDRMFARMFLALPFAIGVLALFWLISGVIGLARAPQAVAVLGDADLGYFSKHLSVIGGSVADIALGLAILWRPWSRRAALGMVVLSLVYLGGSILHTPALWADPLGPMIKVIPGATLALIVALTLENR